MQMKLLTAAQAAHLRLMGRGLPVRHHEQRTPPGRGGAGAPDPDVAARRRALVLRWRSEDPPVRVYVIADRLRISKTAVQKHLRALRAAGQLPKGR